MIAVIEHKSRDDILTRATLSSSTSITRLIYSGLSVWFIQSIIKEAAADNTKKFLSTPPSGDDDIREIQWDRWVFTLHTANHIPSLQIQRTEQSGSILYIYIYISHPLITSITVMNSEITTKSSHTFFCAYGFER